MRAELKHLQRQLGVTTIYVTHDQAEAMTLADKLIVMHAGCIQQIGPPNEVYRFPSNTFVAGFIGSPPMNFLDCRYDQSKRSLVGESFEYEIGDFWAGVLDEHGRTNVILGVRPEDLVIRVMPSADSLLASVYVIEQMGREILLTTRVGETLAKGFAPPDAELEIGQTVYLGFRAEAIHIFDRDSGASLLAERQTPGQEAACSANPPE
jgi:multiple sugar transport system ATP-binding protein